MRKLLQLALAGFMLLTFLPVMAQEESMVINLQPVHQNTPVIKKEKKAEYGLECDISMVKIRGNAEFKTLPETEANVLYYGKVELGSPAQSYGMLIDFEGAEKKVWADTDRDGDYAEEPFYSLFKSEKFPILNVYFSPTPLVFQIDYPVDGRHVKHDIQFDLPYFIIARSSFTDFCRLTTRTWYTGYLMDNGEQIQVALVDGNDNGCYNDPEDWFFMDNDFNLDFSPKEGKPLKKLKNMKLKSKLLVKPDFSQAPVRIILKKG